MTLIFVNWCCKARIPNQSLRSETMNFSIAYLSPDVTQNFFHEKTFSNHLPTPWTLNVTWTYIKRLLYFLDTFGLNSTSSLNSGMHPNSQWSFLKTHYLKHVQIRIFFWSAFSCIWTEYEDLLRKSPDSVPIQKNTDQKKLRICTLFT